MTFEHLLTDIRQCQICKSALPNAPKPIFQANPQAKILVVGQAPGKLAHETGIAFNDASGRRLRDWMGVDCSQFYDKYLTAIIPMGFCYPGKAGNGDLPPRKECEPAWRSELLAQMTNIELTLVIGRYAHDYHFSNDGLSLTERVKNWREYAPNVFPLPHPSPTNNRWFKQNSWFEQELVPQLRKHVETRLK